MFFFCVRLRTNLFLRVVLVERNNIQTSTGGQCPRWLRCSQNFGFRNVWFVDTSGHLRRNLFPNIRRLQVAWNMLQKNKHILLNKHIFNGIAAEEVVRCGGVSWRACNLFVGTDAYNYKNQVSFKDACFVPVSHGCNLVMITAGGTPWSPWSIQSNIGDCEHRLRANRCGLQIASPHWTRGQLRRHRCGRNFVGNVFRARSIVEEILDM